MADAGRAPYPMVLEKVALVEREVVDPGRDIVDEAKVFPRPCALVVPAAGRETDAGFFGSGALAVFGRVALASCQYSPIYTRHSAESCVRETLVALLAMDPGGRIPERELVVAEVISRSPACGMRDRVDALA